MRWWRLRAARRADKRFESEIPAMVERAITATETGFEVTCPFCPASPVQTFDRTTHPTELFPEPLRGWAELEALSLVDYHHPRNVCTPCDGRGYSR